MSISVIYSVFKFLFTQTLLGNFCHSDGRAFKVFKAFKARWPVCSTVRRRKSQKFRLFIVSLSFVYADISGIFLPFRWSRVSSAIVRFLRKKSPFCNIFFSNDSIELGRSKEDFFNSYVPLPAIVSSLHLPFSLCNDISTL